LCKHNISRNDFRILSAIIKVLLLAAAVFCTIGCARHDVNRYITIGALLPLTGMDSDEGLRALNGLQLAKEEINAAGGVLKKKLDIIVLNDRGDEEYIVKQYKSLMDKGVAAIIGSSDSNVTLALAVASEKDGIPVISPTATNAEVTYGLKNVFYSSHFSFDDRDENAAQFVTNYFNSFSQMPLSASAAAYASVYMLAEAVKNAGTTNKEDIISALKEIEMDVITGRIKFNENNAPRSNVYIIQIKGGKYSTFLN